MRTGFDACATTLANLLRPRRVFNIPAFQRPYSWTTDEAGKLLDDLLIAFAESTEGLMNGGHFLGPIVLLQCSGADHLVALNDANDATGGAFQIIDGQQRLATLTVLLSVMRDLAREQTPKALPDIDRMIACQRTHGEVDRFRLEIRGSARRTMAEFVQAPGTTLREAPPDDLTEAETLLLAARDQFIEVLHDRDVATLERLAAFIVHDCDIAVAVTNDVDRAHRIFSVLNNRGRPLSRCDIICAELMDEPASATLDRRQQALEALSERLGTDFDALFSHVRAALGPARLPVIADIQRLAAAAGGGGRFIDEVILPFGEAFDAIKAANHRGSPRSDEINRRLRHLSWLSSSEWVAPTLLWWLRYGDDAETLAMALKRLERLTFGMRVLGLGSDKRQARMHQVRAWVEQGHSPMHDSGPLDFTKEEIRNIRHNLRDLHRRSQLTCKLVLMRLDSEASGGLPLDTEDLTVEHILPQKPARNSRWRDLFSDAEERQACTASLGNLVLVPKALNERARNQDYQRKLAIFFAPGGPALPYLTEELRGTTTWTAELVRAREERLVAMIAALWHLEKINEPGDSGDAATEARGRSHRGRKTQPVEPPPPH